MRPPYYRCMKCGVDVYETRFPLHSGDRVPLCPKCGSVDDMDIVLGDEHTAYPEDMVIYVDDDEEELQEWQ